MDHQHEHPATGAGTVGGTMSAEHIGHDHSSVGRNPDGSYYYTHGAFLGHVVPGSFFVVMGIWWLLCTFEYYLKSCASSKTPFTSKSWYRWPWQPQALRRLPLEPFLKVCLPLIGILGELWAGHPSYRVLMAQDGKFVVDHINDWQHASMYLAFLTSGVVDLLGHGTTLPPRTEHGFLGLAFLVQLLLLAFHLKGPSIEFQVHLILVLLIAATVVTILAEMAHPSSVLLATTRSLLTLLQGVWWIQTAYIMYRGNPAWDPDYMGSTMMGPVILAVHILWIATSALAVLLLMRRWHERREGRALDLTAGGRPAAVLGNLHGHPVDSPGNLDLELSALIGHKPSRHSSEA